MNTKTKYLQIALIIGSVLLIMIAFSLVTNSAVSVYSQYADTKNRTCIIIDAGHGGVDGGAVSCTGVYESQINLEIALRLNDLLQLLGYHTKMIRTEDISVYTKGNSIAEKKVSDLKERVRIVNNTNNPILISIHQNFYYDSQYSGAQVFYTENGQLLAKLLQSNFNKTTHLGSKRPAKKATGIYLMEHIACTGILVECGFLSNPTENLKLQNPSFQKNICSVIATTVSNFLCNELTA